jgi:hypothetical protein
MLVMFWQHPLRQLGLITQKTTFFTDSYILTIAISYCDILVVYRLIGGAMILARDIYFEKWGNTPNLAIVGNTSMLLIEKEKGVVLVLDELGRIEHGIFI